MKIIDRFLKRLDKYQQTHHISAFTIAVLKKYNEDGAGRQAALLTYYSFLSLFPLILILVTVTDDLIGKHTVLGGHIVKSLTDYFPVLGNQLSAHVHSLHGSGPVLVVGVLFTLYGARGVANAFRRGVQSMWMIPRRERASFPKSLVKSLILVVVGGAGFVLASVLSSLASSAGHGLSFRILSIVINLGILFWLYIFLVNFSLPKHITVKETALGAAIGAVSLVILQSLGGYILSHELKKLDALYSNFAISLGLLFWIYLQTKVLYYSIEISVVSSKKLWPRSLNSATPTEADNLLSNT